ncbi:MULTISPECIES: DUF4376 domain-containing protein [Burkholderia]|uniref:DUF4376 domain-containing protein n=1 Tax=Burkholderia TaxID=32008 RepID=UPI000554F16F|nr:MULTISPECIES: hypothetical protein [Burkholderia]AOJ13141.1 hypothetical protein WJ02_05850 [Burkholderia vietnamiensis]TCT31963.1 hypothetical protein EC918_102191 [Burkholderia vietnamiensis]SCZ28128.1 hypothetical protein SAMN02787148_106245 [Burkholderia vietnamiensis]SFX62847.1 hypothetical protein SAMN02787160_106246 [Burkholderia vietnamiensis]HDR9256422.1 hypothetical protein [Burkholderia vietnamiensis]
MGQKYAAFDAQGNITAFYDSVDSPVPAEVVNTIEITPEQWQTCIEQQGQWHIASGALAQVPPPTGAELLAQSQTAQIAAIDAACAAEIVAGFTSSALGQSYVYPAKSTDQQNLSSCVLSSLFPNLPSGWTTDFWCADAAGNWSLRPHTAAQIQQVGVDGKTAISNAIMKKVQFEQQVMAATTIEAVRAIVWS